MLAGPRCYAAEPCATRPVNPRAGTESLRQKWREPAVSRCGKGRSWSIGWPRWTGFWPTAPTTGRAAADVKRFNDYRSVIEAFINAGGINGAAGLP